MLLPLYPTLSGQLGAIAREYGLPSKGGLIVYLLELSTEIVSDGPHQAFVGGPRISEEAWSLLWSRLFELESLSREPGMGLSDENALEFSENEEDEQPASNLSNSHAPRSSRPPVPPVPQQHRLARAPEERYSDESSRASIADGSEEHSPEPYSATTDSTSQSITSPTSKQYNHQRQSATAGPPRSPPVSQSRPASRASKRSVLPKSLDTACRARLMLLGQTTDISVYAIPSKTHCNFCGVFGCL